MSEFTTNAEANVSAAKGVLGGYCYRAPLGTELPDSPQWRPQTEATYELTSDTEVDNTKTYYTRSGSGTSASPYVYAAVASPAKANLGTYYEKIDAAWKNMGYIGENGETFGSSMTKNTFRDQNGDVIGTSTSGVDKTFGISFAETKKAVFESIVGADNVTDEGGVLTVHDKGPVQESYTYAWLFLLKNGRKWVRFAESASITEINDVQTNNSTELAWGGTFTAVKGPTTGDYFTDLFESTETE